MEETPPAAAPAAAGSAFGFMQETPPAAPAPAAPAAPSGSAFGFMQETPPAAPAPAAPPAAAGSSAFDFMQGPPSPARQQKATFDPLSQNYQPSPTSQQRMMQQQQINPQFNPMYTQQNMMMMQKQMQQMQMAMAMQNQGQMAMPPQQQAQRQGSNPNVMAPGGFAATTSFSFLDGGGQPPKKKEIKSFDFVQDAMKSEKKK
jgi:hypothetical protein